MIQNTLIIHLKLSEPRNMKYNGIYWCFVMKMCYTSGLFAGPATLGNSYNLHLSKMAAMYTTKIIFLTYRDRMVYNMSV